MDYQKIYNSLILCAQLRPEIPLMGIYTEKHHIVPRSLGGSNEKANIVHLTAREHFVAHWLLYLIYKNTEKEMSMAYAFNKMCAQSKGQKRYRNSRGFEIARKYFAKNVSLHLKGKKKSPEHIENMRKSRKGVPSTRSGYITSEETKNKISKALKGFKHSEETKNNMRLSKIGKPSNAKGKTAWNKGKTGHRKITPTQMDEIFELLKTTKPLIVAQRFGIGKTLLYQLTKKFKSQQLH